METEYLGFIISQEGIKVDPVKTKAIRTWARPTRKKEIQSVLGFCNFYRRFIEGFSKKAKPLYQLTEKDKRWEFGEKQPKAFENLIHKLTHAPILAHYMLRSLSVRLILAAGNVTTLTCLASRLRVPYTQW